MAAITGPQVGDGKPSRSAGPPAARAPEAARQHRRSGTWERYGEQRTVRGQSRRASSPCPYAGSGLARGRCGGDMSTPQKRPPTRHYLQTTSDNRRSVRFARKASWSQSAIHNWFICETKSRCRSAVAALLKHAPVPAVGQQGPSAPPKAVVLDGRFSRLPSRGANGLLRGAVVEQIGPPAPIRRSRVASRARATVCLRSEEVDGPARALMAPPAREFDSCLARKLAEAITRLDPHPRRTCAAPPGPSDGDASTCCRASRRSPTGTLKVSLGRCLVVARRAHLRLPPKLLALLGLCPY